MNVQFEIFLSKDEEFYFRLRDSKGSIMLVSEGYTTKANAIKGIHSIKKNIGKFDKILPKESENGKFFYLIKAGNGQIIAKSSLYNSENIRNRAVRKVQKEIPESEIIDLIRGGRKIPPTKK